MCIYMIASIPSSSWSTLSILSRDPLLSRPDSCPPRPPETVRVKMYSVTKFRLIFPLLTCSSPSCSCSSCSWIGADCGFLPSKAEKAMGPRLQPSMVTCMPGNFWKGKGVKIRFKIFPAFSFSVHFLYPGECSVEAVVWLMQIAYKLPS